METYYVCWYTDFNDGGKIKISAVTDRDSIPASARTLRTIEADNEPEAIIQYVKIDCDEIIHAIKTLK